MITIRKNFLIVLALILVTTSALLVLSYIELPSNHHAPSLDVNATEIAPDEILGMEKLVVSNGTEALQRVKQSHTGRGSKMSET